MIVNYICECNGEVGCLEGSRDLPPIVTTEIMVEVRKTPGYYVVLPDHIDDDVEIVEKRDGYTVVNIKDH